MAQQLRALAYSYRVPKFISQLKNSSSNPPITQVLGDLPSSCLWVFELPSELAVFWGMPFVFESDSQTDYLDLDICQYFVKNEPAKPLFLGKLILCVA